MKKCIKCINKSKSIKNDKKDNIQNEKIKNILELLSIKSNFDSDFNEKDNRNNVTNTNSILNNKKHIITIDEEEYNNYKNTISNEIDYDSANSSDSEINVDKYKLNNDEIVKKISKKNIRINLLM